MLSTVKISDHDRNCLLIGFLALFFIYLPAFYFDFGVHNDYQFYFGYQDHHPEFFQLLSLGRPVNAFLQDMQFFLTSDVSDLKFWRFLAFCIFTLTFCFLYFYFKKMLLSSSDSLGYALLATITPSSQLFVLWSTNFVPGALVHFIGILFGIKIGLRVLSKKELLWKEQLSWSLITLMVSIILFLIYPPNATILLVLICFVLILRADICNLEFGLSAFFVAWACIGFVLAAVYVKFFNNIFVDIVFDTSTVSPNYKSELIGLRELPVRLYLVLTSLFPGILNPFQTGTGQSYDVIFGSLVALLIIYGMRVEGRTAAVKFSIGFLALIVVTAVHIVTFDWAAGVRNYHPAFLLGVILFWSFLKVIPNNFHLMTGVKISVLVLSIFFAGKNVFEASYNANLEYQFVKREVFNDIDLSKDEIYVVPSTVAGKTITGKVGDPGNNGMFLRHIPNNFMQMALNYTPFVDLVRLAIHERGYDFRHYNIIGVHTSEGLGDKNVIVFDNFVLH